MRWSNVALAVLVLVASSACQTEEPGVAEVPPAEELWAQGEAALEGYRILGVYPVIDYDHAIEIFQSIVDNYPYSDYAVEAELKIADAYFDDQKYEEALSYYRDFSDLHPQHPKVAYTIWRAALCHERQVLAPYRDQAATREALALLDRLLLQHPHSEYTEPAEALWRELQIRLAENVEGIADFYYDHEEFEAAAERYRALLNEYPGLGLDARILFKLGNAYERLRRLDEAERIYRTLVAHYSETRYAFQARRHLSTNLPVNVQ